MWRADYALRAYSLKALLDGGTLVLRLLDEQRSPRQFHGSSSRHLAIPIALLGYVDFRRAESICQAFSAWYVASGSGRMSRGQDELQYFVTWLAAGASWLHARRVH